MVHEIIMPQLGLTMTEGAVTTWLKQPGERIEKGEMLFTVETDKVEMEVESTGTGFVNTVAEPGKMVPVGSVIAVLTERADALAPVMAPVNGTADEKSIFGSGPRPASPRARALAKSLGIDIRTITPARGARIIEEDVKNAYALRQQSAEPVPTARRITAERMTQSFEKAPHFYLGMEARASALVKLREELQETAQRRLGFHITYTDFLLKALAGALREQPGINAYWENGAIVKRDRVDVGFAVQSESALLVAVIPKADELGLFALAARRHDLTQRARAGKLQPAEMQGGSATLSNLGTEGVDWFQAILNPPQSVILAAGAIAKRPLAVEDRVEVGHSLILTLSADHRVLDGVAGARFLSAIRSAIEHPHELLI
ncbi:MAG: dihydrolipoamide acetyltransferase family protein [Bryobacteraceae bacterium]